MRKDKTHSKTCHVIFTIMFPNTKLLALLGAVAACGAINTLQGLYSGLYPETSPVQSLGAWPYATPKAYEAFAMVEFYSAWCGHCKHFAPTYEAFASAASVRLPALKVAAVECNTYNDVCNLHGVNSFPTIKLFPGSIDVPVEARDSADKLLAWVEEKHPAAAAGAGAVPGLESFEADQGSRTKRPPLAIKENLESKLAALKGAGAGVASAAKAASGVAREALGHVTREKLAELKPALQEKLAHPLNLDAELKGRSTPPPSSFLCAPHSTPPCRAPDALAERRPGLP